MNITHLIPKLSRAINMGSKAYSQMEGNFINSTSYMGTNNIPVGSDYHTSAMAMNARIPNSFIVGTHRCGGATKVGP